jgi:hypothetical protein
MSTGASMSPAEELRSPAAWQLHPPGQGVETDAGHDACIVCIMQAKKKTAKKTSAGTAKPKKVAPKKKTASKKNVAAKKKTAPKKVASKKPSARRMKAAKPTARPRRGDVRAAGAARKPSTASTKAPKIEESHVPEEAATAVATPHVDTSRDPLRGGLHDGANHSKPDVQLHRQHVQTMRSPERRHTMRGH